MGKHDTLILAGAGLLVAYLIFKPGRQQQESAAASPSPNAWDMLTNPIGSAQRIISQGVGSAAGEVGTAFQGATGGVGRAIQDATFGLSEGWNVYQAPSAAQRAVENINRLQQSTGTSFATVHNLAGGDVYIAPATSGYATPTAQRQMEQAVTAAGVQYGFTPRTGGQVIFASGNSAPGTMATVNADIASRMARGLG